MARRWRAGRSAVAGTVCSFGAAVAALWVSAPVPVVAEPIDVCDSLEAADWCLDFDGGLDDGGADPGGVRPVRDPVPVEDEGCEWTRLPDGQLPLPLGGVVVSEPPEGQEVVWQGWCYNLPRSRVRPGLFRWVPVGEGPGPVVTAEDVARGLYERVQGRMPEPAVATDPPPGADAVVDVPVFVRVTNWTGALVETGNLGPATVTVRARPSLVLEPGEPGAGTVACAGPGRAYDPGGGDLWAQAAVGEACTYAFQHRTGVERRPDEWPFTVRVRWSISWAASSGASGSFPVVERSVSLPRAVTEVQAIVMSGGG